MSAILTWSPCLIDRDEMRVGGYAAILSFLQGLLPKRAQWWSTPSVKVAKLLDPNHRVEQPMFRTSSVKQLVNDCEKTF